MKLSQYIPVFGFMNKATIYVDGEYRLYYDMLHENPDYELDEGQLELLDIKDVFGLIAILKLDIPQKELIGILRNSLDNYRKNGREALHWLYKAINQVRLNPENCNPMNIGAVENHLLSWIESFERYPFDVLKARNDDEDTSYRDATLGDLFVVKSDLKKYAEVLRSGKINVIDKKNRYMLGERQKGAIVAWVDVLEQRGKMHTYVKRETLAHLLNEYFANLNISGRTLSNTNTTAAKKFRPLLLALIK